MIFLLPLVLFFSLLLFPSFPLFAAFQIPFPIPPFFFSSQLSVPPPPSAPVPFFLFCAELLSPASSRLLPHIFSFSFPLFPAFPSTALCRTFSCPPFFHLCADCPSFHLCPSFRPFLYPVYVLCLFCDLCPSYDLSPSSRPFLFSPALS